MPALIDGSPTHVLIVHAVAVLLPAALLAALMLVAVPGSRRAFALPSVGLGLVACLAVPLAFLSGGKLRALLPPSPLIAKHVALAHQLLPDAAVFGVALAGFVALDMRHRAAAGQLNQVEDGICGRWMRQPLSARAATGLKTGQRVAAALLVGMCIVTAVTVVRVGDSGAHAAWQGRLSAAHARA